jgi:hypothetical protein
MAIQKYRYRRAVGAHNKGDTFEADERDPSVVSLLGAGYADPVLEPAREPEPAPKWVHEQGKEED